MGKFIDLTGQKFGRLTAIERTKDYIFPCGTHMPQWRCECDCGNKDVVVLGSSLRNGNTKSCGCLNKELTSLRNKKYNQYDLSGEYGIGYTSKGEEFYFDLEDYDLIKDYYWHIDVNEGYVLTAFYENKKHVFIRFHRLIMNATDSNLDVDHIHGYKTRNDNRKSNLRICTRSQNNMNQKIRKDNKTGIKGVCWDRYKNKWVAHISIDGKLHRKRFSNFEDATKQRQEWERKFFGEYSYSSSQKKEVV